MGRKRRRRRRREKRRLMTIKEDEEFREEDTSLNVTPSSVSVKVEKEKEKEEEEEEEEEKKEEKVDKLGAVHPSYLGLEKPHISFDVSIENCYLPFNCNTCGKKFLVKGRTFLMDINSNGEESILIDKKQPFTSLWFTCKGCRQRIVVRFSDFSKEKTNKLPYTLSLFRKRTRADKKVVVVEEEEQEEEEEEGE